MAKEKIKHSRKSDTEIKSSTASPIKGESKQQIAYSKETNATAECPTVGAEHSCPLLHLALLDVGGKSQQGSSHQTVRTPSSEIIDSFMAMRCRICGKKKKYVMSLFDDFGKGFQLVSKLKKHLQITIKEGDNLPQTICQECLNTFMAFESMFTICAEAEKAMKCMVEGTVQNKNAVEPAAEDAVVSVEVVKEEPAESLSLDDDEDTLSVNDEDTVSVTFEEIEKNIEEEALIDYSQMRMNSFDRQPSDFQKALRATLLEEVSPKFNYIASSVGTTSDQILECSNCQCVIVGSHLQEHSKLCTRREKPAKPLLEPTDNETRGSKSKGIDTKRLKELLGVKEPETYTFDNKFVWGERKIHGKYYRSGGKYICELCRAEFLTGKEFKRHIHNDCPTPHFPCTECEKMYRTRTSLLNHVRNRHTKDTVYTCDICGMAFFSRAGVSNHIHNHLAVRKFKCELCPKIYKLSTHLREHMRKQHAQPMPTAKYIKYICEVCSGQFSNESILKIHQLKHKGVKEHMCDKCAMEFHSEASLNLHKRRWCTADGVKKTNPRGVVSFPPIQKTNSLALNLKTKSYPLKQKAESFQPSQKSKSFPLKFIKCKLCPKTFLSSTKHKLHVDTVHLKLREFKCSICVFQCVDSHVLAKHKADQHPSRTFTCPSCSERFLNSSDLELHLISHKNSEMDCCPSCGKLFEYRVEMIRHIKIEHLHYKCDGET